MTPKAERSLAVKAVSDKEPVLMLGGQAVERVKTIGWEYIPTGGSGDGKATRNSLLLITDAKGRPRPVSEMEFAEALYAEKKAYQEEHKATKVGAVGGGQDGKGTVHKTDLSGGDKPVRYSELAAETFGIGETRVKELIRLAHKLDLKDRKRFASGKLSRAAALDLVRRHRPSSQPSMARAIRSMERALAKAGEVSAEDRERLARLAGLIVEVLGESAVIAESGAIRLPRNGGKGVKRSR